MKESRGLCGRVTRNPAAFFFLTFAGSGLRGAYWWLGCGPLDLGSGSDTCIRDAMM